jgi:poly-gamma-glutamate synthesis protein (capsule biosynthesis protein)
VSLRLFLAGDVMLGRGVDQIFPQSCPPELFERACSSAEHYVELAEAAHGPIPRAVSPAYVWGDALAELSRLAPDARIANLETSITTSEDCQAKGINYRMHPGNVAALKAARLDVAVLANNHVLDWGREGLVETLETLEGEGIRTAGAGRNLQAAEAPAILELSARRRVVVVAFGSTDSGIPASWAAAPDRPGANVLSDLGERSLAAVARLVRNVKRPGDVVIASLHWGPNWGYRIPNSHRRFAHGLIDHAGVDLVHGHSSHHPLALEVYHDHLIIYGCGDFIDDYEGIGGYERFRDDLVLMYFPEVDVRTGALRRLEMTPMRIHKFRLERPSAADTEWLGKTVRRECRRFGGAVSVTDEGSLVLEVTSAKAPSTTS